MEVRVDIDRAQRELVLCNAYIEAHRDVFSLAEAEAMNSILGLVLTGVEEGLVLNGSGQLDQLKRRLYIAFCMGYYHRAKQEVNHD